MFPFTCVLKRSKFSSLYFCSWRETRGHSFSKITRRGAAATGCFNLRGRRRSPRLLREAGSCCSEPRPLRGTKASRSGLPAANPGRAEGTAVGLVEGLEVVEASSSCWGLVTSSEVGFMPAHYIPLLSEASGPNRWTQPAGNLLQPFAYLWVLPWVHGRDEQNKSAMQGSSCHRATWYLGVLPSVTIIPKGCHNPFLLHMLIFNTTFKCSVEI